MQAGFNAVYDCIKAFSETDRTDDLKKFDVPTLVIQGDDEWRDGSPHGLCSTLKDQRQRRPPGIHQDVGATPPEESDQVFLI